MCACVHVHDVQLCACVHVCMCACACVQSLCLACMMLQDNGDCFVNPCTVTPNAATVRYKGPHVY